MSIEFNLSNIIFVLIALISGVWALVKIIAIQFKGEIKRDLIGHFKVQDVKILAQYEKLNSRLDTLDAAAKADAGQWQRVERELLTFKADLPMNYVRREDYIRGQSTLEAKIDGLGMRLEKTLLHAFKTST